VRGDTAMKKTSKAGKGFWRGRLVCVFLVLTVAGLVSLAAGACDDPPVEVILTVVPPVNGTIELNGVNCPGGSFTFPTYTAVTIGAEADPGHEFLNWAPHPVDGTPYFFVGWDNPFGYTLESNATVEAYFCNDARIIDPNLEAVIRYSIGDPCADLDDGRLQSLTSLILLECGITDLTGLDLLPNLTELFILYNQIGDFSPLSSLYNLTTLVINGCGMDDVDALEDLDYLDVLDLRNNEITNLGDQPFSGSGGIMTNNGIGEGDTLYLSGNPLSLWTTCIEIPELIDRGVDVVGAPVCDNDPESTGDQDGDGFTNAEELRFLQYFYNDPAEVDDLFHWYLLLDTAPDVSRECYDNLDTVSVTVEVQGQGSVWLGDGPVAGGNSKTWEFCPYVESCSTLCSDPSLCGYNNISFVAVPEQDWVFWRWIGPFVELLTPELTLDQATLGDYKDSGARAEFLYRPGMGSLDFVADLDAFLLDIGAIAQSMAPELYDYDTGETEWVPDGAGGAILELRPNGIPDAVELLLLQHVLQDVQFDLIAAGGASHIHTWRSWEANLAVAESQIVDPQLDYVACLVAAYMTLGTPGHKAGMEKLILDFYAVALDTGAYDTSVTRWFEPEGDIDNDGAWNVEEWENVEEALGETVTDDEVLGETVGSCMNPNDGYKPPPPPDGTFVHDGNSIDIDSLEHQALVADATGANEPLDKTTVTFGLVDDLSYDAFVIDPPGFASVPMPQGTAITCALGRKFRVKLTGDTRWFKTWTAEDTLIHGSPSTSETFILGNATQQVTPGRRALRSMQLGDYIEWTGVGPLADEITVTQDPYKVLHVPEGTFVKVKLAEYVQPENNCPLSSTLDFYLKVSGKNTYVKCLTIRPENECTVERVPLCSRPLWIHTMSGDGGIQVFGLQGVHSGDDLYGYILGAIKDIGPWSDQEVFSDSFVGDSDLLPGFQREKVSLPGEGPACKYGGEWEGECSLETGAGGIEVSSEPQSTLKVTITSKPGRFPGGYFDADEEIAGNWYSIGKYLPRVTECVSDTSLVRLTAIPQRNYCLRRWTGTGNWMNAEGEIDPDGDHLSASDHDYQSWVTDSTIYVKCPKDRQIEIDFVKQAVVWETYHEGIPVIGTAASVNLSGHFLYNIYNAAYQAPSATVQQEMLFSKVFVYFGHGGDLTLQATDFVPPNTVRSPYKLIMLHHCNSYNSAPYWKQALQAECAVGWTDEVSFLWMATFDFYFWQFLVPPDAMSVLPAVAAANACIHYAGCEQSADCIGDTTP